MSDHLAYMLWKAGILVALAFVWGLICGLMGKPMDPRRWNDKD